MTRVATLAALLAACSTVEGDVIQHPLEVPDASLVLTTPPPDELVWWQSIGGPAGDVAGDAVLDGERIVVSLNAQTVDAAGLLPHAGTFLYVIKSDVEVGADKRPATTPNVFGPTGQVYFNDLAAAAGGGVLAAGEMVGPVEFSPTLTFDAPSATSGRSLLFVANYADDQPSWISTFELEGSLNRMSISSGAAGSYLALMFGGTLHVGESTLVAVGDADGALIALDPSGEIRWVRQLGGSGFDGVFDVALAGDAVIVCWTTEFSGGTFERHLRKYDVSGAVQWERDGGGYLAPLEDGSFYSAWSHRDEGAGIERHSPDGTVSWSVPLETVTPYVLTIATEASGRVIVGGKAYFGGGGFLEVFDPTGALVLGRVYPGDAMFRSIVAFDSDVVIAGYYSRLEGPSAFALGGPSLPHAGDLDAFFARLRL